MSNGFKPRRDRLCSLSLETQPLRDLFSPYIRGASITLNGTGFSPYIKLSQIDVGSSPRGMPLLFNLRAQAKPRSPEIRRAEDDP